MALVKLDVPILAQEKPMCCWHTSAMMIWQYWQKQSGRIGPMNTMTPTYVEDKGLSVSAQSFITLGNTTGLDCLPAKNAYSADEVFALLRDKGPLWCAGTWYGFGHVIVITGISGGTIYINDPDRAQRKENTMSWFNEKLLKGFTGCVMAKNPKAY